MALVAMLAAALFTSAISVIYVKHLGRKLFVDLQVLQRDRDAMQVEWGQLQLEQSTWATHDRIEQIALSRIELHVPPPESLVVVTLK